MFICRVAIVRREFLEFRPHLVNVRGFALILVLRCTLARMTTVPCVTRRWRGACGKEQARHPFNLSLAVEQEPGADDDFVVFAQTAEHGVVNARLPLIVGSHGPRANR
jgi:hypothetical protein